MADNSSLEATESTEAMEPISQVSEAIRVIEDIKEASSKCLVNKHQCHRLADRVNAIGEVLPKMGLVADNTSAGKVDYPAFDMLLSVLQKAKALVSKYATAAASVPNVLIRTEDREAFKEAHMDLDAMSSQFFFENFESSTSENQRNAMLTDDGDQDLKEISESLDVLAKKRQAVPTDLEQVKRVVSEKSEGTSDDALPSFLRIDPSLVGVLEPVRHPERLSNHDPVETDGWTLVRFGTWLGCKCALKVFQSSNKTWNRSELLKEAQALMKLHHPHIVQLMGFAQDDKKCLILMELMDTDLRHFMKSRRDTKRPFSRAQELEIITQIARGMYYLHEQQYVHGELKCSNILIKQFPGGYVDVKVSDLRSCQSLGVWDPALFKERIVRCRPRWAAPEVANYTEVEPAPSGELLKKIDIYSFGMVCYEILTGKLPFQDIQDDALKTRIATGDLRQNLPGELDDNLRGLIENCWERDPENRPTFELIYHKLDFIRSSQPLEQPVVTSISSGRNTLLSRLKLIPLISRLIGGLAATSNPPEPSWGFNGDKGTDTESHEEAEDADTTLPGFLRINRADLKQGALLGSGASATVYEATWCGCKFAAKAFRSRATMQILKKELKFLIELRHPAVVRLMGLSVSANGQCMIVMEFMGGDLYHEMEKRMEQRGTGSVPFKIQDAVYIINRIALGMAYLHSRNVVHRDLKALNVLMPHYPGSIDVKISDFGISELIDSSEKDLLHMAGTGVWRAPELWLNQPYDFKAADVYSFAMTCFEVLTGEVPFAGIRQVRGKARPELPKELMPELKLLIAACWDAEPEKRPTFARICTDLEKIQQGLRTLASTEVCA